MGIEIASLYASVGMDTTEAEAGASKVQSLLGTLAKGFVALGVVAGVGLAIRAVFKEMTADVRAAADEAVGIANLGMAVQNTGANWASASAEIEAYLAAEAKRVSLDDGVGRTSIQKLTEATHDYRSALALMPLAIDLARARHMDLASAAEIVGRVSQGNIGILTRYGIVMEKGATATETLAVMQKTFAGQGEAFARTQEGQWERLQVAIGNVRETAGMAADTGLTRLYSALANLAENALPYVQVGVDAIIDVLSTLGQAGANAFYWGANIVQQFASGLGSGTSYIASVLTSIGDMISSWLSPGSPPKLLPELDTWGEKAAQTYLDGFGGANAARAFAPLGKMVRESFGDVAAASQAAGNATGKWLQIEGKAVWVITQRQGQKGEARRKEKQGNKDAEAEAKRLHDAELQYALATANTSGQIAIMTRELNGVTKGSAEYYQILTRIVGLQKSEANEAKQLSAAKLQWELAQADKGGQIAIWKRELSAVTEGTQEWYDISTKIIQLQKAGGGGGGAGVPANLDKFKEDFDAKMRTIWASMPKFNWEDVWSTEGLTEGMLVPGVKTNLRTMGENIWAEVMAGMKATPGAALTAIVGLTESLRDSIKGGSGAISIAAEELTTSLVEAIKTEISGVFYGHGIIVALGTSLVTASLNAAGAFDAAGTAIATGIVNAIVKELGLEVNAQALAAGIRGMVDAALMVFMPGPYMVGKIKDAIEWAKKNLGGTTTTGPREGQGGGIQERALGGSDWVTKPTLFLAGERGPERVTVTPAGRSSGANITFNISGRNADDISRAVVQRLREVGI